MLKPIIRKLEIYDQKVKRATNSKKRRVLFKLGAYIRQTMKRSIRVSKTSSQPGQPPRVRSSKSPLRQLILFDVDLQRESVTIGPAIFPASKVRSSKPLPELLDQGGTFQQISRSGGSVLAQVRARPFTEDALDKGLAKSRELLESEPL